MPTDSHSARCGVLPAITLLLASAFALCGLAAMLLLSPRVPYADQWLFYRHLLERPFLEVLFAADNGHREVLPKLLRMAELRWLQADQSLQIGVGAVAALATFVVLAHLVWKAALPPALRCAAVLIAAMGLFWLGNERALVHANDAVHVYLITLLLVVSLGLVARSAPSAEAAHASIAGLCALVATFTFGSGIAVLPALLVVPALRRAPLRAWVPIVIAVVVAIALYLAGAREATTTTLRFDPIGQVVLVLHWLAAPLVYVAWPLLDPRIAAQLPPGLLRDGATAIAQAWVSCFGDIRVTTWPQALAGLIGVAALSRLGWRVFREARADAVAVRVALGLAAFGLVVGALIALSRASYFEQFPDQVQATRYLPWSSLFWTGLLIACVLRVQRPRAAAAITLALAVLVIPSEIWMGRLALNLRHAADTAALGAAVQVLDRDAVLGETRFDELAYLQPLLQKHRLAMHAWPETAWLTASPPTSRLHAITAEDVRVERIDNRFDGEGSRVTLQAPSATRARIVVLDASGRAIGLALHDVSTGRGEFRGWVRGVPQASTLSFVQAID